MNLHLALLRVDYQKQSLPEILEHWHGGGRGLWGMLLIATLLYSREKLFH